MSIDEFKFNIYRYWPIFEKLALAAAIGFGTYLFAAQQSNVEAQNQNRERVAILEAIQREAPPILIVQRLTSLEAELRSLKQTNDRLERHLERLLGFYGIKPNTERE